jgi:hypothetical protein
MLEPENDRRFIRLIYDLGKDSSLPNGWTPSTDTDRLRNSALKELSQLNTSDSRQFLAVLNSEAPPHETTDAFLARVYKAAAQLLPHLLCKFRELQIAEARETEKEKFLKNEAEFDPFLQDASLARDAYSGRGEIEPEQPLQVDRWGNVID